ncbi:hypothetical protein [Methanobrevibacter sp.]|uniref:hypothetical protein n=1 Tax=Methanobrevibacter sp. TaxID=66852 RepID=UPI0026E0FDF1|nr:hypothetical protein [Methanobrevibacter sp.]
MMISTVSAVDSSNWKTVAIEGHSFKIPPKYDGGELKAHSYTIGNWNNFEIACVDSYITSNYGYVASQQLVGDDLTINGHPARYFCSYNKYEKTDLSRIYFPVGKSIYYVSWQSSNLSEDVNEIVASSEPSQISEEIFYEILDQALQDYKNEESLEKTYVPQQTYSKSNHHNYLNYYIFYKIGQHSRY